MKAKSWLKYLGYLILLALVLFLRGFVSSEASAYYSSQFKMSLPLMSLGIIVSMLTGVVLGLEHFVTEIKKPGKWDLNVPKMILIGIPVLCISLTFYGVYTQNSIYATLMANNLFQMLTGSLPLFQVIFGYVVITSFFKSEVKKEVPEVEEIAENEEVIVTEEVVTEETV